MDIGDIKRQPSHQSFHNVHEHVCPECGRKYSCNCQAHYEAIKLVCRDCERK